MSYTVEHISAMARIYDEHPEASGVLSTGEMCAIALLTNRAEILPAGYTFLDAFERINGDPILEVVLEANRKGWRE